jgi:hypothetical protein
MKTTFLSGLMAFAALILLAPSAQAQEEYSSRGLHSVYGNVGFTEGGFGLGADYEYAAASTFGIGGYTRFYKKDEKRAPGYFMFGAFIRPHFHRKQWDFYISPGVGVMSIDANNDDETTLGPSLALGLLYEVNSQIAVGIENMKHYVWFSDDYRGLNVDDFMIKGRVSF